MYLALILPILQYINHESFVFYKGDIRNKKDLKIVLSQIDAIVHLAAIVGDPACSKNPDLAYSTNYEASVLLYNLANDAGIKKFISEWNEIYFILLQTKIIKQMCTNKS